MLAATTIASPLVTAFVELEQCVKFSDISYGDGARRKLDVYQPRAAAGAPVIAFFYGGRWSSGAKRLYRIFAAALTARGYVVVIPDYRLYPEVKFPAFVEDGAMAVRWTRDNIAKFGGDPHRLFVMGHSAGAYIAAMLALDPQWLNGVGLDADRDIAGLIGVSGPYDFLPLKDRDLVDIFGGANRAATQPITFAEGHKPPVLLVTGGADNVVDPGNATRLADRLRRGGNEATAISYQRFGHMTVLIGYAPLLWNFFPAMHDLDAFVVRAGVEQRVSVLSAVPAP
jgi:acetyl esterase/lipase